VRALTATGLCAWALVQASIACAQSGDTGFASYAFASETGSGVYQIDGRIIQVYTLPFYYRLRNAEPRGGRPGIKLLLPVTFGLFDFVPSELVHGEIPTHFDSLSFEPGIQLDWWINDAWHLLPYVKAGAAWASSTEVNAIIYGTGLRSEYRFSTFERASLWEAELVYAGVHYHDSDLPNDSFTRLRNGLELWQNLWWSLGERRTQVAPYAMLDIYFNAPSGPQSGISARTAQFETGLVFGVNPMWRMWGFDLPRLGIGYRFAGVVSGWRLVIGDPF